MQTSDVCVQQRGGGYTLHEMRAGLDSIERFFEVWCAGQLPIPFVPCRSEHLYPAYRLWAQGEGISKPAPLRDLLGFIGKMPGTRKSLAWHYFGSGTRRTQRTVVFPAGSNPPITGAAVMWVTENVRTFYEALNAWRSSIQDPENG